MLQLDFMQGTLSIKKILEDSMKQSSVRHTRIVPTFSLVSKTEFLHLRQGSETSDGIKEILDLVFKVLPR